MTHYSHHWTCERCEREEESMDVPENAKHTAHAVVMRYTESNQATLVRIAERAYLRGYMHGKKVATEAIMGVKDA